MRHKHGLCAAILLAGMAVGAGGSSPSAAAPAHAACNAPESRQFDFWIGEWDVFDSDQPAKTVARAKVELILDRCVAHEIYESTDGHRGESFSIYDASRHTWHQTWVTDRGQLLTIEGGLHGSTMVLEGSDRTDDGRISRVRGSWQPTREGVREIAVRSTDGGASWLPWFDLQFRRASAATVPH